MSKSRATDHVSNVPWACISISTRQGEWPLIYPSFRQGLLQLHFADVSHATAVEFYRADGIDVFEEKHAKQILDFMDGVWNDIENLVVHCEAGISRSSGVAAAISLIKYGNDKEFFGNPYIPNMLVYRTILNEAAKRVDFAQQFQIESKQ